MKKALYFTVFFYDFILVVDIAEYVKKKKIVKVLTVCQFCVSFCVKE